jgi:hypothetical protein
LQNQVVLAGGIYKLIVSLHIPLILFVFGPHFEALAQR